MAITFFGQPAASQAPAATSLPAFGQPSAAQPNSGGSSGGTNFQLTPTNTNNVVFSGFGMTSQSQPQQQNHQQQQQQPAAASTPFSFAQPGQQQQQPATSSAAPASGSLFGPAPATGGLFAPKPAVTSAPAAGGLFGAAPAAPAATSLFGAAPAAGTTGLFGAAPATASSLFGAAPATQPQQQSSFGQSQPFSVSQLGASQPAPQQQAQQQQQAGQQQQQQLDRRLGPSLSAKMIAIHQAWDTNNLQTCRFLHYFYSALPPQMRSLMGPAGAGGGGGASQYPNLGRRPDAVGQRHDALWAQATRENPEPGRLVPVLAVGFPDLKVRSESQAAEAERQRQRLADIQTRLTTLEQAHSLRNATRAAAAQRRQVALDHRLLANARRAHLLIPALRGSSVSAEEEALRAKLERCEAELEAVGSGVGQGRIRARVNELWALLGALKAKREHDRREGANSAEWAVVDERALDNVAIILSSQQQGMNHLITTIESDAKALDTVVKGLEGVQLVGVKGAR